MATHTPNYNLRKPAPADTVNVETDIGANMDIIDAALAAKAEEEHAHEEYATDAEVTTTVTTAVNNVIAAAPGALNTLDELAAALNDDANFAATVTTALAGKSSTGHAHPGTYEPAGTVATHEADSTAVHGIANTALLITAATHALIDHDDLPGIEANIPIQAAAPADPEEFDLWIDSDEPALSGGGGAAIAYQPEAPDSPAEGDLWADSDETTPTPSGSTGLLAVVKYDPLAFTTKTATTSVVNLDTTNLIASFTVPASGKVLVRLTALVDGAGGNYYWVVRNAADTELGRSIVVGGASSYQQMSIPVYLTGLTPGALTIRWAHTESAGSNTVNYGQATTGWIPAVIEVWAAP